MQPNQSKISTSSIFPFEQLSQPSTAGGIVFERGHSEADAQARADAEALLTIAVGIAATHDRRCGRAPAGRLARWRAKLDGVMQRGVSACVAANVTASWHDQ